MTNWLNFAELRLRPRP